METLYLLIPVSVALVAIAAWLFLRMSATGQFDDLDSPPVLLLMDDDRAPERTDSRRLSEINPTADPGTYAR